MTQNAHQVGDDRGWNRYDRVLSTGFSSPNRPTSVANYVTADGQEKACRKGGVRGLTAAVVVVPLTTMVSHAFGRTGLPLLLPAIKDDPALSNSKAGLASTVLFSSYLLGVVAVTLLAGRTDPLKTLRLGLLISISGLGLLSMSNSFASLLVGVALSSAGGAGIWITAPLLATQGVSPANRGVVIGS